MEDRKERLKRNRRVIGSGLLATIAVLSVLFATGGLARVMEWFLVGLSPMVLAIAWVHARSEKRKEAKNAEKKSSLASRLSKGLTTIVFPLLIGIVGVNIYVLAENLVEQHITNDAAVLAYSQHSDDGLASVILLTVFSVSVIFAMALSGKIRNVSYVVVGLAVVGLTAGLNDYVLVDKEGVKKNRFFHWETVTVPWESYKSVHVTPRFTGEENELFTAGISFVTADKKIETYPFTNDEVFNIKKRLKKDGDVPLFIHPIKEDELIMLEQRLVEDEETYTEIFELLELNRTYGNRSDVIVIHEDVRGMTEFKNHFLMVYREYIATFNDEYKTIQDLEESGDFAGAVVVYDERLISAHNSLLKYLESKQEQYKADGLTAASEVYELELLRSELLAAQRESFVEAEELGEMNEERLERLTKLEEAITLQEQKARSDIQAVLEDYQKRLRGFLY